MVIWWSETWPFMKIIADPLLAEMPVLLRLMLSSLCNNTAPYPTSALHWSAQFGCLKPIASALAMTNMIQGKEGDCACQIISLCFLTIK